jgi:hypothetical protein
VNDQERGFWDSHDEAYQALRELKVTRLRTENALLVAAALGNASTYGGRGNARRAVEVTYTREDGYDIRDCGEYLA